MDGLHGDDARIHISDAQQQMSMHYMHEHEHGLHHMSNGDGMEDDHDNGGNGGGEGIDADVTNDAGNISDGHGAMIGANSDNNQLTLSFQGQVYVFDSVSPEKVQTVLLLLGGREVPPAMPAVPISANNNNRATSTTPQRLNVPQRMASLIRFREKRKERSFDKKICYTVNKEVALRMQRNKGQFTSSKPIQDESSSAANSWDSSQSWGAEGNASQQQETRVESDSVIKGMVSAVSQEADEVVSAKETEVTRLKEQLLEGQMVQQLQAELEGIVMQNTGQNVRQECKRGPLLCQSCVGKTMQGSHQIVDTRSLVSTCQRILSLLV